MNLGSGTDPTDAEADQFTIPPLVDTVEDKLRNSSVPLPEITLETDGYHRHKKTPKLIREMLLQRLPHKNGLWTCPRYKHVYNLNTLPIWVHWIIIYFDFVVNLYSICTWLDETFSFHHVLGTDRECPWPWATLIWRHLVEVHAGGPDVVLHVVARWNIAQCIRKVFHIPLRDVCRRYSVTMKWSASNWATRSSLRACNDIGITSH